MNVKELKAALTKKGIEYAYKDTKAVLQALLSGDVKETVKKAVVETMKIKVREAVRGYKPKAGEVVTMPARDALKWIQREWADKV